MKEIILKEIDIIIMLICIVNSILAFASQDWHSSIGWGVAGITLYRLTFWR